MTDSLTRVKPKAVYDKDNILTAIEIRNAENNEFVLQAVWDERDEHTPENVKNFMAWLTRLLPDMGYKLVKGDYNADTN